MKAFLREHSGMRARTMKLQGLTLSVLLAVAAVSWCAAHAQNARYDEREEVSFRPWIGTLGIRFQSESLYEDTAPLPGAYGELSGQASAAGVQGFGLGGEWRPFRNGFRLDLAMYLDPVDPGESEGFRSRALSDSGSVPEDLISLPRDFEPIPYVGLGWQANDGGLDVNLDVGAFLSEEHLFRNDACPGSDSRLFGCGSASYGDGQGKLSGSFRKFEWYPVVSLGIEYRF